MKSHLSPTMKSVNNSGYLNAGASLSTNVSQIHGIMHSSSSRDFSPQYKDTTFGTSKRMHIPPSQKLDFIVFDSMLSRRNIAVPRSPRKGLQEFGLDAPAPTKYDVIRSSEILKPNKGNYSFGKPGLQISFTESNDLHSPSHSSPGPGDYNIKHLTMGTEGLKYSMDTKYPGYSYLPNSNMLKIPPVNKYDPKPANLKMHLIKDGLGIVRSEKSYSYMLNKNTPGPGDYDLINNKLISPTKFALGKIIPEPRHSSAKPKEILPGPNHYQAVKPVFEKHDWEKIHSKADMYRKLRRPNLF